MGDNTNLRQRVEEAWGKLAALEKRLEEEAALRQQRDATIAQLEQDLLAR